MTFRLELVGILLLAGIDAVPIRTALCGTASILDSLVICPGLNRQQDAPNLAKGEYPACAAMTSGYVFRVENEATVFQLQRLGKPGHLTTLKVLSNEDGSVKNDIVASINHGIAVLLCVLVWSMIAALRDWCALASLTRLILACLVNAIVIQSRAALGWKGALEPGVEGDLLVLLSQDRWIRMQGLVDDLKAVTSGQWLREPTFVETTLSSLATIIVYIDIAMIANARVESQLLLLLLFVGSAALLGISNHCTTRFYMYGKLLTMDGEPKKYERRLDLADDLIKQTGRKDWAIRLGMVQAEKHDKGDSVDQGPKIM